MPVSPRRRMRLVVAPALAFALGTVSPACGPMEPGEFDETESEIIGGTVNTGDPAVVQLLKQSSLGQSSCTASVIAPTLLLTAAHCVNTRPGETDIRFGVSTVPETRNAQTILRVKETHFDQLFNPNDLDGGHDIGVVILEEPVAIAPLALNRAALNAGAVGEPIRLVGYGLSDGVQRTGAGVKRQVTTQVGAVQNLYVRIDTRTRNVCSGDSGGPALMRIGDAEVIVGVASYVNSQTCTGSGFHLRVDQYLDFVDPYLAAATTSPPPSPEEPEQPTPAPQPPAPTPGPTTPSDPDKDEDVLPQDEEDQPRPPSRPQPTGTSEEEDVERDASATETVKPGFRGETVGGSCTCLETPKQGSAALGLAILGLLAVVRPRRR